MRGRFAKVALVATLVLVLSLVLTAVAFAATGTDNNSKPGHDNGQGSYQRSHQGPRGGTTESTAGVQGPVVKRVAPKSGPAAGGARVTIMGTGFQDVTAVNFGTVAAASYKVLNSHVIAAVTPAGTAGQTVDVAVTTSAGTSATGRGRYTYRDKTTETTETTVAGLPVVQHVAPKAGPAAGGVRVTIKGDGFKDVTGVSFGTVPAVSFKVQNVHVIVAVSPAGVGGEAVHITVTTSMGTSATGSGDLYTYRVAKAPVVRYLAPRSGPIAGGARVIIVGEGFGGATAVTFGTESAASFKILNDHVIAAVSPAGPEGQIVDVTVTTPLGTSPTGAFDRYTFRTRSLLGLSD